ncbi:hypothetical protein GUJ93_ZPchr0159g29103 [Zizania palustris]|uniref:Uncharacterized protein n=1 Tax=Zizania palustris TaxID=103762 RepID=A0A8J5R329_ZIZPA|nr:hypothetical protein GUJ93_ZPchr0159g29103 [Zizania palustris]
MPPSYLTSSRFSYHKLKKLPPPPAHHQDHQYCAAAAAAVVAAAKDYYNHRHARRRVTWRSFGGGRRRRPRLRISSLTRVLRRKAAAVGDAVRASVTKVVRRLKEGSPYVGDLFAGNYMFMQVTPSPTMTGLDKGAGALPYYQQWISKSKLEPWRPVPGVLYKV